MNLSNLHPAAGSKHSDAFRVGRGHGSGETERLQAEDRKVRNLVLAEKFV